MRANPSAFERNDHDSSTPAALIQISIAHIDRSGAKRYNPPLKRKGDARQNDRLRRRQTIQKSPSRGGGRTPKRLLTAAPNDTKIPLKRRGTHAKTTAYSESLIYCARTQVTLSLPPFSHACWMRREQPALRSLPVSRKIDCICSSGTSPDKPSEQSK